MTNSGIDTTAYAVARRLADEASSSLERTELTVKLLLLESRVACLEGRFDKAAEVNRKLKPLVAVLERESKEFARLADAAMVLSYPRVQADRPTPTQETRP